MSAIVTYKHDDEGRCIIYVKQYPLYTYVFSEVGSKALVIEK